MPDQNNERSLSHDVPIGEIVRSMALAVVEAQAGLDRNSMRVAEMMSGTEVLRDVQTDEPVLDAEGNPTMVDRRVFFGSAIDGAGRKPVKLSMMELGFTPTFYQFAETTVELRLALRVTRQTQESGDATYQMRGAPVDAYYQGSFGYDLSGACVFKTRIVPVPSPPLLEDRVRQLLSEERRVLREKEAVAAKTASGETTESPNPAR